MSIKGRLSCARCSASFPFVSILKCDNTILGITLTMCNPCHRRFHPTCHSDIQAIRPDDLLCDRCLTSEADVVCPQCPGNFKCTQLCESCSSQVHEGMRMSHLDHIQMMPK